MENNPAKKIIEKIKQEKIVPESKFFLNWKNYLFWTVWVLTVLLGAIFFSLIILNLLDIHPMIFRSLGLGKVTFIFFKTAPYLWIILALLTIVSGFYVFRKTKHGYRHSLLFVTSVGVLLISMLGTILHISKINKNIGNKFFAYGPVPRDIAFPEQRRWQSPMEGMLGGEVILVGDDVIELKSFNDDIWEVQYSDDTEMRIRKLKEEMIIEVLGEKIGINEFRAFLIQPFPFEKKLPRR